MVIGNFDTTTTSATIVACKFPQKIHRRPSGIDEFLEEIFRLTKPPVTFARKITSNILMHVMFPWNSLAVFVRR